MALAAAEIAAIVADMTAVQPSSAQIQRATNTTDSMGGRSRAFSTVATVACRVKVEGSGASESQAGGKIEDAQTYRLAFPAQTDVRITDRVVVGGMTLAVDAVNTPTTWEFERIAHARKVAA